MNFDDAIQLGTPIRRTAWSKYIFRQNGVWLVQGTPSRVVSATDVTAEDLLAGDWTNLDAAGVVVAAQDPPVRQIVSPNATGTPATG